MENCCFYQRASVIQTTNSRISFSISPFSSAFCGGSGFHFSRRLFTKHHFAERAWYMRLKIYADEGECYLPWWKTASEIVNCFIISLACVSSETHNLQRVFRPGGKSLIQAIWVCAAPKGMFFSAVLV